jgi:ABC-2 type transport system ATP-binding protein
LARALLTNRSILLLDEPTRSLDPVAQRELWRLLRTLVGTLGKTVLLVTHSVAEAQAVCDRVAILQDGTLVRTGTPAEVWGNE